jgi:hypothetical protein
VTNARGSKEWAGEISSSPSAANGGQAAATERGERDTNLAAGQRCQASTGQWIALP